MRNYTIKENEVVRNTKNLGFDEKYFSVTNVFKVIGGKWKVLLINSIAANCPKRFGELKREMDDVAQATLTSQLRELERDGIICREAFAESPPRVEYKLTELGKTLLPLLKDIQQWWDRYSQSSR